MGVVPNFIQLEVQGDRQVTEHLNTLTKVLLGEMRVLQDAHRRSITLSLGEGRLPGKKHARGGGKEEQAAGGRKDQPPPPPPGTSLCATDLGEVPWRTRHV